MNYNYCPVAGGTIRRKSSELEGFELTEDLAVSVVTLQLIINNRGCKPSYGSAHKSAAFTL